MKAIHEESDNTYGAPRIAKQLGINGDVCSKNRVARIMQKEGIFSCVKRRFKIQTTDSNHSNPIAPRVFRQEDSASKPMTPNRIWGSDTTYLPTGEGWLYLTVQQDFFTRKIVSYVMEDEIKTESVWETMRAGLVSQPEALGPLAPALVAHSDRGGENASYFYAKKLKKLGITQSMSRSGNCYDNAYVESFFHTLKVELVNRRSFKTRAEAKVAISRYIDDWYNPKRLHSGLGYQAPNSYERLALAA